MNLQVQGCCGWRVPAFRAFGFWSLLVDSCLVSECLSVRVPSQPTPRCQTLTRQGGNFLWSKIAPALVEFENHRTEVDMEAPARLRWGLLDGRGGGECHSCSVKKGLHPSFLVTAIFGTLVRIGVLEGVRGSVFVPVLTRQTLLWEVGILCIALKRLRREVDLFLWRPQNEEVLSVLRIFYFRGA